MNISYKEFSDEIEGVLFEKYGIHGTEAESNQLYFSIAEFVRRTLAKKYYSFKEKANKQNTKTICYLSMEFLLGKSLKNNLLNLGMLDFCSRYAEANSVNIDDIFRVEHDAGLGNGGLGRLAASYLEAMASGDYSGMGFSLLYEHGMFTQVIRDGDQYEIPDNWLDSGDVWLTKNTSKYYKVKICGKYDEKNNVYKDYKEIRAIAYDMFISGYFSNGVSLLKLWKAIPSNIIDLSEMEKGNYEKLNRDNKACETINMFLYPPDNTKEGKCLRIIQQYFFVSASVQSIIAEHYKNYRSIENLADHVVFHINDTHPALCIPEIIRVLCDDYGMSLDSAYDIVLKSVSYTNHTVMPEALEVWDEAIVSEYFPRIYAIIKIIAGRQQTSIYKLSPSDWQSVSDMSIICGGGIHMARLAAHCSSKINGVSALHTEIIKNELFSNHSKLTPEKFVNVTNGISYRRWLCSANEELSACIDSVIGTEYRKRPYELANLKNYRNDKSLIESLDSVRYKNKVRLSDVIMNLTGRKIDPHSMFDVQIKRLHEYKRQLLNVIKILSYYSELISNPGAEISPKTFIFSAKAAPTYYHAKRIIKLINKCGEMIENNARSKDILKVVFVPNYSVSLAELIIPAADISEQISLAGKEASGTGNMKFMLNGALTLGTYDGANVEISELAGDDNIYIFGLRVDEVERVNKNEISPNSIIKSDRRLAMVIDMLKCGIAGEDFSDIADYLTKGNNPDPYLCLYDYQSYVNTYHQVCIDYNNKKKYYQKSIMNIASSGYFASDRAIEEYADKIWFAKKIK